MASLERNNKILLELSRQPGNNVCADCGAAGEPVQNTTCTIIMLTLMLYQQCRTSSPDILVNEQIFGLKFKEYKEYLLMLFVIATVIFYSCSCLMKYVGKWCLRYA